MPIQSDDSPVTKPSPRLASGRDPKAAKSQPGSLGEQAFRDAVFLVVAAWALLFLLAFSLRRYNI